MNFLNRLIHKPRQTWIRKAMFQVHLWVGIILGIYVLLVAISGSVLIFRNELIASTYPDELHRRAGAGPQAAIEAVLGKIHEYYPSARLQTIYTPQKGVPAFRAFLREGRTNRSQFFDPITAEPIELRSHTSTWLEWVTQLHFTLLLGRNGLIVNGVGSGLLLLMCMTGIFIWWPGVKLWLRALTVDFGRNWKRINYDLHSAVGFWTLAVVSIWALSGVYFIWNDQIDEQVERFTKIPSMREPEVRMNKAAPRGEPDLEAMVRQARAISPAARVLGVTIPRGENAPALVYMARTENFRFLESDYIYFHPATGEHLYTWLRGVNRTPMEWFLWLQYPLHFGNFWGMGVKVVWLFLSLGVPVLTVSGVLMYWNRYLGKKWALLHASDTLRAETLNSSVGSTRTR